MKKHTISTRITHKATNLNDGPDRWMVTLDGDYEFEYSKGVGLRTTTKFHFPDRTHPPFGPTGSIYEDEKWQKDTVPVDPTLPEVLQSLAIDATCYLNSRDIDDFASEFGIEVVSEAVRAYRDCERAWKHLRATYTEDEIYNLSSDED